MNDAQQLMVARDFDRFLSYTKCNKIPFTFELFVDFSTSLVNFYVGSNSISISQKAQVASALLQFFNNGLKNKIDEEDITILINLILENETLNYQLLQPIFDTAN